MHNGLETLNSPPSPPSEEMTIAGNNLVTFTLRDCKNLRRFTAGGDKLKSFDLSGCDNLSVLSISGSTDSGGARLLGIPCPPGNSPCQELAIRGSPPETNRQLVSLDATCSSPSLPQSGRQQEREAQLTFTQLLL